MAHVEARKEFVLTDTEGDKNMWCHSLQFDSLEGASTLF